MKEIIKGITYLFLFLSLSLVFFDNTDIIKADSGWDTDYDSSWDSSSDYDYDYDYDSDYDYDYNDDDDYSSTSSSSSSDSKKIVCKSCEKIFAGIALFVIGVLILLFIVAIIIRIINLFQIIIGIFIPKKRKNKKNEMNNSVIKNNYKPINNNEANSIIADFNIEEFNFKAYQMFYDIQIAWMNFEYDKLRELVTDELYNSYIMQLNTLKIKNQKNTMNGFELINVYVYELNEENGTYIAKVYLDVKFFDYIEDINTAKILRGNSSNKINNTYLLTFISSKEKSNNVNYCPRCGAKVEGNITSICQYCNTKIINKNYNWVMSKKEKINQR